MAKRTEQMLSNITRPKANRMAMGSSLKKVLSAGIYALYLLPPEIKEELLYLANDTESAEELQIDIYRSFCLLPDEIRIETIKKLSEIVKGEYFPKLNDREQRLKHKITKAYLNSKK